MQLPDSIEVHTSTLCIYKNRLERMRVTQAALLAAPQRSQKSLLVADPELTAAVDYMADHSGVRDYFDLWPVDSAWQSQGATPADALELMRARIERRDDEGFLLLVDLGAAGAALSGPDEAVSLAEGLRLLSESYPMSLLLLCSYHELPAELQARLIGQFSQVYLGYSLIRAAFGASSSAGEVRSLMLDLSLQRLALSEESLLAQMSESVEERDQYELPRFLKLVDEVIVIMDSTLRISYISPAIERHISKPAQSLVGRGLASLTGKDSVATAQRALSRILHRHLRAQSGQERAEGGRSLLVPISAEDASGREVLFEASVTVYEAAGRVCGYVCVLRRQAWRGSRAAARRAGGQEAGGAIKEGNVPGDESVELEAVGPPDGEGLTLRLTPREFEIIQLLLQGMTNVTIATQLHIAEVTVKKHLTNIYRKLGVRNRYEVMKLAR